MQKIRSKKPVQRNPRETKTSEASRLTREGARGDTNTNCGSTEVRDQGIADSLICVRFKRTSMTVGGLGLNENLGRSGAG